MNLKNEEYEVIKEWLLSLSGKVYVIAENSLARAYETVELLQIESGAG